MSVRVGLSFGAFPFSGPAAFWRWVDACEESNVDSLWFPERLVSPQPFLETLSTMAAIAGRSRRLKFGMDVSVLPIHEPVMLAKQCATIDYLSEGRFIPGFGIGADNAPEFRALDLPTKGRGGRSNEMLALMSRLWNEDNVDFDGKHFQYHGVSINPKPVQSPLPFWIGGNSEAAIERTARYAHGWISGSVSQPPQVAKTIAAIQAKAKEFGREIDDDHFGAGFNYRFGAWDEPIVKRNVEQLVARVGPSVDPKSYIGVGDADDIVRIVESYVAIGVSKFVLRPIAATDEEMMEQTRRLVAEVLPRVEKLS